MSPWNDLYDSTPDTEICAQCGGYCDPAENVVTNEEYFCSEECLAEYRRQQILEDWDEE